MSVSDPISDMICIIKNGFVVKKENVIIPSSKVKHAIVDVLKNEGFISKVEQFKKDNHPVLKVTLKYDRNGDSVITNMVRQSKPGCLTYISKKNIPKVKNGFGITIVSTNKGVLSGRDARLINAGGEILCKVW